VDVWWILTRCMSIDDNNGCSSSSIGIPTPTGWWAWTLRGESPFF
jgi:hypothetical protein